MFKFFRNVWKKPAARLVVKFTPTSGGTVEAISVIQDVAAAIGAVDAKGNPAPLPTFPSPPVWTVDDATILTVAAVANGLTGVITAVGKVGTANLTITPPAGTLPPLVAPIQVTNGPAATLVIAFGTPAIQTPGVPPPPAPPPPA